jgi:hypothetical protein
MHYKKKHKQLWTGDKSLLYDTVKVQSFFRTSGLQKYFVVDLGGIEDSKNVDNERRLEGRLTEFQLT